MTLHKGQRVEIRGEAGTCAGEVLHAEDPANLPSIYGAPEAERVRGILAEWDITELALIEHTHEGRRASFFALRDRAGNWRDLQRQPLTITPIHGSWEIKEPTP
jgi:hypothetical protein